MELLKNLGFKFVNNFFYLMLKKYSQIVSILFVGVFCFFVTNASAIDLDEATRTVVSDGNGKTTVLTPEQVKRGKRLFNATCGACHLGGITKTNPNVGLDPEALSLAVRVASSKSIADAVVTKRPKIPTNKIETICEYFLSIS